METIKENNKRYIILMLTILVCVSIFIFFDSRVTLSIGSMFIISLVSLFSFILYSRKKYYLILLSAEGIKFKRGNQKNEFKWNDLKIELKRDYIKYFIGADYELSSIENSKNKLIFSICWENEKSIIELTKKYAPQNNDLYKVVMNYAEKRGINF